MYVPPFLQSPAELSKFWNIYVLSVCYGLNFVPPKFNETVFGDRTFKEVRKFE